MTRIIVCVLSGLLVLAGGTTVFSQDNDKPGKPEGAAIDLAICLDTSNSMDGLIDSAKHKLWAIVNELATAKPKPLLRVALYHYGNDNLAADTGWVQQVVPLTDDLDTLYGKLFELKTRGGTEYVARVIQSATTELKWNPADKALKMIVVAGNEPATQDKQLNLQDVCKQAITRGIVVNTIFCGAEQEGRNTGWADAARWADGRYAAIDQNAGTVAVVTPFDQKIADLGGELNKTYVAYGQHGLEGQANQAAQDRNAGATNAPVAAQRAVAKSSALYTNARWDLVDAANQKAVKIEELKEADLPDNMKKMTPDERKAYVDEQARKRAEIQKQIQDLNAQREAFVKAEMDKKGLTDKTAFDAALRQAVREQAQKKDFQFESK